MSRFLKESTSSTWDRISLLVWSSDWQSETGGFEIGLWPWARHFIILASSVDRYVNGGPVGRNWLIQRFQMLNLSFTFQPLNDCKDIEICYLKSLYIIINPTNLFIWQKQYFNYTSVIRLLKNKRVYIDFKDRDANATGCSWSCQTNEMAASYVTGKQRCSHLQRQQRGVVVETSVLWQETKYESI